MSLRFQNQNTMREPEFQAALLELLTQLNSNVKRLADAQEEASEQTRRLAQRTGGGPR